METDLNRIDELKAQLSSGMKELTDLCNKYPKQKKVAIFEGYYGKFNESLNLNFYYEQALKETHSKECESTLFVKDKVDYHGIIQIKYTCTKCNMTFVNDDMTNITVRYLPTDHLFVRMIELYREQNPKNGGWVIKKVNNHFQWRIEEYDGYESLCETKNVKLQ